MENISERSWKYHWREREDFFVRLWVQPGWERFFINILLMKSRLMEKFIWSKRFEFYELPTICGHGLEIGSWKCFYQTSHFSCDYNCFHAGWCKKSVVFKNKVFNRQRNGGVAESVNEKIKLLQLLALQAN